MVSNQILQEVIDGQKAITGCNYFVADTEGLVLASTEPVPSMQKEEVLDFVTSQAQSLRINGYYILRVLSDTNAKGALSGEKTAEYLLGIRTAANMEAAQTEAYAKLCVFQMEELLTAYQDRFDKDNFIKNLILDNMLLVDIYSRAKKLHIENDIPRVVFYIESDNDTDTNLSIVDVLRSLYPQKDMDFITAIDEKHIILVKDARDAEGIPLEKNGLEEIAETLENMISTEVMGVTRISFGSLVSDLRDISRSYKEAKMALEVGKIFYEERHTFNYNWLGIGRLIYHLPNNLCHLYLDEIFSETYIDDLDEETLLTINKFFQNSLNISETARQLYIHRNTLVYRLDKLQRLTGLDIRNFEDAITLRIALMVSKFIKNNENRDF